MRDYKELKKEKAALEAKLEEVNQEIKHFEDTVIQGKFTKAKQLLAECVDSGAFDEHIAWYNGRTISLEILLSLINHLDIC